MNRYWILFSCNNHERWTKQPFSPLWKGTIAVIFPILPKIWKIPEILVDAANEYAHALSKRFDDSWRNREILDRIEDNREYDYANNPGNEDSIFTILFDFFLWRLNFPLFSFYDFWRHSSRYTILLSFVVCSWLNTHRIVEKVALKSKNKENQFKMVWNCFSTNCSCLWYLWLIFIEHKRFDWRTYCFAR